MKAGLGSYAFRYATAAETLPGREELNLTGFLDFCKKHNVRAVQICENMPLHKLSDSELSDAYHLMQKYDIEPEIGTTGYEQAHLEEYIRIAAELKASILRTVLNAAEDKREDILTGLAKVIPMLEKKGVTLAIENHFDLAPEMLVSIVEDINHPSVRICIDPLNSITRLRGLNETFSFLSGWIVSAHIKDVRMVRNGTSFMLSGCPLGQGIADAGDYILKVYRANPGCNIFLEQWMDPLESAEATLAEEEKWVVEGLKFLTDTIDGIKLRELNLQI